MTYGEEYWSAIIGGSERLIHWNSMSRKRWLHLMILMKW